jgi:nicotinamidase-related amidase
LTGLASDQHTMPYKLPGTSLVHLPIHPAVTCLITKFDERTALLVIDAQMGVDVLEHWGGRTGRRNNPHAEANIAHLLESWRTRCYPVFFTLHDSREAGSPLRLSLPTGRPKPGLESRPGEVVITKDVNGAFIGTKLELQLRRAGVERLVVSGFFTNFCVETTVRHAGNLAFDTYLAHDACATSNRIGLDGTDYDPELVHNLAVASMHGEFCTAIATQDVLGLLEGDNPSLQRVQGNE